MYSDLTPIFPAESSSRPIALITGASRGIGKAIAETFAQAGYDLILTCRQNREKLETLCKSLSEAYSIQAAAFIGDLGDYETVKELFAPIRRLNLLVNNAGISHIGLLTDMSPDQWHPADRLGQPEEVGLLALKLAESPLYLTGQIITMDGGFL